MQQVEARRLVEGALTGSPEAVAALLRVVLPVAQRRLHRALQSRGGAAQQRDVRQEVEDLCQDTVVALFARGGRALRQWDPERGLSLEGYVGLVAERTAQQVWRSKRRNPWTDQPAAPEDLPDRGSGAPGPEQTADARGQLAGVLHRLRSELSPRGLQVFDLLLVEQREVEEVAALTGLQAAAIYTWRTRLRRRAREIHDELVSERGPTAQRTDEPGAFS